jgi:uncharacterized protein YjbI with pentapeptide repeats
MEILTAYIRTQRPWKQSADADGPFGVSPHLTPDERPILPVDIDAVLTILKRRRVEHEDPKKRLDLSCTDLRGARLGYTSLVNASFSESNLDRADFDGSDLRNSSFWHARLRRASFGGANLQNSYFAHADMLGAFLSGADLSWARMQNANLHGVRFGRLVIDGAAVFPETNLDGADFRGARLEHAEGLSQQQVDRAFGDEATSVPPGLAIKMNERG